MMTLPFRNLFQRYFEGINWLYELKLIVTAITLGGLMYAATYPCVALQHKILTNSRSVGAEVFLLQRFPNLANSVKPSRYMPACVQLFFSKFPESLFKSGHQMQSTRKLSRQHLGVITLKDIRYTRRTTFGDFEVTLLGWPSRGGVIVLEHATAPDFEFLDLIQTSPPQLRDMNQENEDIFCRQLLLLGAKWYDSIERYDFILQVRAGDPRAINDLEHKRALLPTTRERRWISVGWLREPNGAFLIANYEISMYWAEDEENFAPDFAATLTLARTMEERCKILRKLGARYYASLDQYRDETTFLRALEWKKDGEVGPLIKKEHENEAAK